MTCAKRVVRCHLEKPGLPTVVGENRCGTPVIVCPRREGDDYSMCRAFCRQPFHAETEALHIAQTWGLDYSGGTAIIYGHTRICDSCKDALLSAGIAKIVFGDEKIEMQTKT